MTGAVSTLEPRMTPSPTSSTRPANPSSDTHTSFGDRWVACDGPMVVVVFRRWGLAVTATPLCSPSLNIGHRHYFLKRLADIVNSNAKREGDVDIPERWIRLNCRKQRSEKAAEVIKTLNLLSARAIQKAEDGESRLTSSSDCVSGMFHNPYDRLCVCSISRWGFQKRSAVRPHPSLAEPHTTQAT